MFKKVLIYVGNAIVIMAATAAGHVVGSKIKERIDKKYAERCAREEEQ